MTTGLVYVALDKPFEMLAAHTLRHSRQFTDLPMHVFTNIPDRQRAAAWDEVTDCEVEYIPLPQSENRAIKTRLPEFTPFDHTLYMDVDCVLQRPGIEELTQHIIPGRIMLGRYGYWPQGAKIQALYVRALRMTGVKLPVNVWYGALLGFDRNDPLSQEMFARWYWYWHITGRQREMPALCCAMADMDKKGVQPYVVPRKIFAATWEDKNAVIQHDYAGTNIRTIPFITKFALPNWQSKAKKHAVQHREQWNKIDENAALPVRVQQFPAVTVAPDTLCICNYVYGWYKDLIPTFIFSALRAYPDYYVRIFVDGILTPTQRRALDMLREHVSDHFDVQECFSIDPKFHQFKHTRWVLQERHFWPFRHVYLGDIDMLLLRETPDILTHHQQHCAATGLPYSNVVRPYQPGPAILPRMSGLQYMDVPAYFERMQPVIDACLQTPILEMRPENNEMHLYQMIKQADMLPPSGFAPYNSFAEARPHHGLHMGLLRTRAHDAVHAYSEPWAQQRAAAAELLQDGIFERLIGLTTETKACTVLTRTYQYVMGKLPAKLPPLASNARLRDGAFPVLVPYPHAQSRSQALAAHHTAEAQRRAAAQPKPIKPKAKVRTTPVATKRRRVSPARKPAKPPVLVPPKDKRVIPTSRRHVHVGQASATPSATTPIAPKIKKARRLAHPRIPTRR